MTLEEIIRRIVREEIEAALTRHSEVTPHVTSEPGDEKYVSSKEAARIAGVSTRTIQKWVREGHLPRHKAGRLNRVQVGQLKAYLARSGESGAVNLKRRALELLAKPHRRSKPSKEY